MDINSKSYLLEQIALYENKIKVWKEKIREELKVRQELKEKLNEAKQREAAEILVLERLDEYEEMLLKQIELTQKMEDPESLKKLAEIEKYESMLREQQAVWAKYKEQYEQLPLAKEKRRAENELLKVQIEYKLLNYRINEEKRKIALKEKISKRQEQLKIINLAKLYVEEKEREKHCEKLMMQIKDIKNETRELELEVEELERQVAEKKKLNPATNKTFLKTQQLPQIDLSRFIIRKDNSNYNNYDSMSINSYILEQEYMNADEPTKQSSQSQDQTIDETSQEKNTDSEPMDVDSQEKINSQQSDKARKIKNKVTFNDDQNKRMDIDSDNACATDMLLSNQSARVPMQQSLKREHDQNRRINHNQQQYKRLSQENQADQFKETDKNTLQKRANQYNSTANDKQQQQQSRGFVSVSENKGNLVQVNRPVPSPAKLQKQTVTESHYQDSRHQQQQQLQPQQQQSQKVQQQQQYQQPQQQNYQQQQNNPNTTYNYNDLSRLPQSVTPANAMKPSEFVPQRQLAMRDLPSPMIMDGQYQRNDQDSVNNLFNMTMQSGDNAYGDNISAILGSDITEPGGSFELVRRIYGDSDLNSEEGDMNYTKIMGKFFSPIPCGKDYPVEPSEQQQQVVDPASQDMQINSVSEQNSQEQNFANFTVANFGKKQTNTKFF